MLYFQHKVSRGRIRTVDIIISVSTRSSPKQKHKKLIQFLDTSQAHLAYLARPNTRAKNQILSHFGTLKVALDKSTHRTYEIKLIAVSPQTYFKLREFRTPKSTPNRTGRRSRISEVREVEIFEGIFLLKSIKNSKVFVSGKGRTVSGRYGAT